MAPRRGSARCWFQGCSDSGRPGRVLYTERGGSIELTLCDEHGRLVTAALADRRLRWGVLVTSHEPSHVIVEEPRRHALGRYRTTFVVPEEGGWPDLLLRRSLHSPETMRYMPAEPRLRSSDWEEGVKYEALELSAEEAEGPDGLKWPKSVLVERVNGGYTDRQAYTPHGFDWAGLGWLR